MGQLLSVIDRLADGRQVTAQRCADPRLPRSSDITAAATNPFDHLVGTETDRPAPPELDR